MRRSELRTPAAVTEGSEVDRVPWSYPDWLLGPLGEGYRLVRELESMVGDVA